MASEIESPAQFDPLRKASRTARLLVIIFGPVLWLVALILVSLVLYGVDAIELGLIVTLVAFLFSLVFCWVGRRRRISDDKAAAGS